MDGESGRGSLRSLTVLLAAVRGFVALMLVRGTFLFLRHGRELMAHLGRPDAARIALSAAEIVGAALFLFAPTVLAGGLTLLVVLAWAAGFHFAVSGGSGALWFLLFVVAGLAAATRAARTEAKDGGPARNGGP